MKYAKGYNSKNKKYIEVKSAGYIQIDVKVQPNLEPVSSLSCSVNNLLVTCNGLASYDPEGFPLSYKFIYGDNFVEENSTGLSTHAFSQEGLTTVQLIVTDNLGLTNSTTMQVMPVRPPNQLPEIAFSCISKSPWSIECNANGTKDNDGSISLLTVTYDDQVSENFLIENNFSHTFSSGGTHNVKVVAIDNDGGISELTKSISVLENTPPTVSLACLSTRPFEVDCQITSSESDLNDSVVKYDIDVGNNQIFTTTDKNFTFNFQTNGTFLIKVKAYDQFNGVGSNETSVNVLDNKAPLADFNCSSLTVQSLHCESTSKDEDGTIVATSFLADDNSSFNNTTFDYTFSNDNDHSYL